MALRRGRRQPPIPTIRRVDPTLPAPVSPPPEPDELDNISHDLNLAYRTALMAGMGDQSASWAAHAIGLRLVDGENLMRPWTLRQVRDMAFYRAAHRSGRLRG